MYRGLTTYLTAALAAVACVLAAILLISGAPSAGQSATVAALEAQLRQELASPIRWCNLGDAYLESGQHDRARFCYRRAVELGPNLAPILMRTVNFYIQLNEPVEILPYTKRLLVLTRAYDEILFTYFDRLIAKPELILPQVLGNRAAATAYFRHLLARGQMQNAPELWNWLSAEHAADDRLAAAYIQALIAAKRHAEAVQAWVRRLGPRAADYPGANLLFNASFEHEPTGAAFDWSWPKVPGLDVVRDASAGRHGATALRLTFHGTHNLNLGAPSQLTWLPAGRYRFRALVKTDGLTTDQGIFFQVVDHDDPERLNVKTEPLAGSHEWTSVEIPFAIPAQARLIVLHMGRSPSRKLDSKIAGTVWLDDLRLQREP